MNQHIFFQYQDITNSIINQNKMFKCKAYNCDKEATKGFMGCSIEHGYDIKTIPQQIKKAQDGANWLDTHIDLKYEEVGAIEHYSLMI